MSQSSTSKSGSEKSRPKKVRLGAYVVAVALSPLSLGCSGGDFGEGEDVGVISQAVCVSNELSVSGSSASTGNAGPAFDNNTGTRWESQHGVDPQWIQVDLGAPKFVNRVRIDWEAANAKDYSVRISNDPNFGTFQTLVTKTGMPTGNHRIDDLTGLEGVGRYVRVHGTARNLSYGYSIWEMDVYGDGDVNCNSGGSARSISSNLEAEDHDGMSGVNYEGCSEGGQNAGWIDNGDWIEWTIDVPSAGNYTVTSRSATTAAASYEILVNGSLKTTMSLSSTGGWQNWQSFTTNSFSLSAGVQTLRIRFTSGGQNLNYIKVNSGSSCTPTTCAAQGKNCGTISDGCGGTLNCGSCPSGSNCDANVCTAPSGSCFKIRSQRTNNYLFNNGGLVTPGASAANAEIFEKIASGNGFQFKARSNNVFVGISGDDLAVNGGATVFTEQDCSSGGQYPNGKGYRSPSGSAPYWKVNDTAGAVDTNNGGNGSSCVNGSASSWERFYLESVACPGDSGSCTPTTCAAQGKNCGTISDGCGGTLNCGSCPSGSSCNANVCVASNDPCGGACGAGQTCNISGQCVTESCGGSCGMGQKCVNGACVNDTSASSSYYNAGRTLETVPSGFFGPNVKLYKHDSNQTTIANEIASAFAAQRDAQFGTRRDAFLFAPGTYSAELGIGFNTEIAGLGDHPDTVTLTGWLWAPPPTDMGNNGTQTFWRAITNFKHTNASMLWAVSQAAPARRIRATGGVDLHMGWGWQSGGFIADSVFDTALNFGSQQQFYTRNSHVNIAENGTWNIMFQGVTGNKPQTNFPTGPKTDIATSPVVREKPFLYVNRDGLFKVFRPALRTNASGPSWTGAQQGTSIPLSKFHVARSNVDTSTTMNNALAAGKHLLITPGVYYLDAPLAVNHPDTIVLGMGLATLTPNNGVNAINVADVPGVTIAGVLIDAGTGDSHTLIQVGPPGSSANNANNPIALFDIFTRIGGRPWVGKAQRSLVVNSHHVIIDHTWLWRADHGDFVSWTGNTAKNGLIVNGNNVISYGTHVEHFQEYQVIWNGNNGRNYFFQNEMPYEAPDQNSLDNPPAPVLNPNSGHGYASYKVADNVTNHEFWGGGCYAVFTINPGMQTDRCIEAPASQMGVKFRNVLSISLTANGKINNLINNDGLVANPSVANIPKVAAWH